MTNPFSSQVGGDHYSRMKIQPAFYSESNKLTGLESSVVKYVSRHRNKGGKQDLEKAIHCLQLLIKLNYEGSGENTPGDIGQKAPHGGTAPATE